MAQYLLASGANDLGGTLINESISTSADAGIGQLVPPAQMRRLVREAERADPRMAKPMTKSAIIAHMSQKSGLAKKQVVDFFDQLEALAVKEAKNIFVLPQFGRLVLANRKARMGRNPQTGEPIKIPAKRVVKFRLAKSLKDSARGKK